MNEIPITEEETSIANKEGMYLYGYLRKKYSNDSTSHLDIIMNSLCFGLLRMVHLHVRKEDRKYLVEVINDILKKGIERD